MGALGGVALPLRSDHRLLGLIIHACDLLFQEAQPFEELICLYVLFGPLQVLHLDVFPTEREKSILHIMLRPFVFQNFDNLNPLLAELESPLNQQKVLIEAPGAFQDSRIEVCVPMFPTNLRTSDELFLGGLIELLGDLHPLYFAAIGFLGIEYNLK